MSTDYCDNIITKLETDDVRKVEIEIIKKVTPNNVFLLTRN